MVAVVDLPQRRRALSFAGRASAHHRDTSGRDGSGTKSGGLKPTLRSASQQFFEKHNQARFTQGQLLKDGAPLPARGRDMTRAGTLEMQE